MRMPGPLDRRSFLLAGGALLSAACLPRNTRAGAETLASAPASSTMTLTVDPAREEGTINPLVWGVNSPGRELPWSGNTDLIARVRDAGIRAVRYGAIQHTLHWKQDLYPQPGVWNFDAVDRALNTIFDAGAQPIFLICGFPAGVAHDLDPGDHKTIRRADWDEYARCMAGLVRRYNQERRLGKYRIIRYWEMWNEPTIEGDGTFPSHTEYARFVKTVGGAMKSVDPSIRLIGPADAWSDLGPNGYTAFTAKNLEKEIDVLCWHDYGPGGADEQDDQATGDLKRLAWTGPHYGAQVAEVLSGGPDQRFVGPGGKRFGVALTEYNWTTASRPDPLFNERFHDDYNVVFTASAIRHALVAGAELFCFFTLAQAGANYLSLLTNTDFAARKPYPVFTLFGRHLYTGPTDRRVTVQASAGLPETLEYLAVRSGRISRLLLINKSPTTPCTIQARLRSSGGIRRSPRGATCLQVGGGRPDLVPIAIPVVARADKAFSTVRTTLPPLSVQLLTLPG